MIQDIIGDAEAFLRINRDKLSSSQIEEMQQLINNLRRYLDQIWVILEQVVKETDTQIVAMNAQLEEKVGITIITKANSNIFNLIEYWFSNASAIRNKSQTLDLVCLSFFLLSFFCLFVF